MKIGFVVKRIERESDQNGVVQTVVVKQIGSDARYFSGVEKLSFYEADLKLELGQQFTLSIEPEPAR